MEMRRCLRVLESQAPAFLTQLRPPSVVSLSRTSVGFEDRDGGDRNRIGEFTNTVQLSGLSGVRITPVD